MSSGTLGEEVRGTPRARSPHREEAPCPRARPVLCRPPGSETTAALGVSHPQALGAPPPASLLPVSPSPAVLALRTVPVPLAAPGRSAPARHPPGCRGGAPTAGLYPGAPRWRGAQHQGLRPARPCSWLHRLPQLLWGSRTAPRGDRPSLRAGPGPGCWERCWRVGGGSPGLGRCGEAATRRLPRGEKPPCQLWAGRPTGWTVPVQCGAQAWVPKPPPGAA